MMLISNLHCKMHLVLLLIHLMLDITSLLTHSSLLRRIRFPLLKILLFLKVLLISVVLLKQHLLTGSYRVVGATLTISVFPHWCRVSPLTPTIAPSGDAPHMGSSGQVQLLTGAINHGASL